MWPLSQSVTNECPHRANEWWLEEGEVNILRVNFIIKRALSKSKGLIIRTKDAANKTNNISYLHLYLKL